MAHYFPIFLTIEDSRCVVVGGGEVAARKAGALLAAGARVTAVAPAFCTRFDALDAVERLSQTYDAAVLEGARIVIAATDDPDVNEAVSRDARAAGALVNVVDEPALCDFIVPATVSRGDLTLSVSTGGACPALSARIRRELEDAYPEAYADFLDLLREIREEMRGIVDDVHQRGAMLKRLAGYEFLASFVEDGPEVTRRRMRRFLAEETRHADGG